MVCEGQDRTGQVWKGQVESGQVGIGQVRIGQVGQVKSGQVKSGNFMSGQFKYGQLKLGLLITLSPLGTWRTWNSSLALLSLTCIVIVLNKLIEAYPAQMSLIHSIPI